jgi:hypothetical protein
MIGAESASVFCGSSCASAPRYGGSEDVGIIPIVVSELEFRDVQRQIFPADLVERAHDAALQERPEAVGNSFSNCGTVICWVNLIVPIARSPVPERQYPGN